MSAVAVAPRYVGYGQAASLTEWLAWHAYPGRGDVTPDRALYVLWRLEAPFQALDETLPAHFTRRDECTRPGDQWVWASDVDLTIVAHRSRTATVVEYTEPLVIVLWDSTAEVLADEDRYQDRLDQLAGIAREAVVA